MISQFQQVVCCDSALQQQNKFGLVIRKIVGFWLLSSPLVVIQHLLYIFYEIIVNFNLLSSKGEVVGFSALKTLCDMKNIVLR